MTDTPNENQTAAFLIDDRLKTHRRPCAGVTLVTQSPNDALGMKGRRTETAEDRRVSGIFRLGFAQCKAAAVDRCRVELRGNDGDEAIQRCIAAIQALDASHYQ